MVPTGAMTGLLGAPLLLWLIPRLSLKSTAQSTSKTTLQTARKPTSRMFLWLLVLLTITSIVALFVTQSIGGWVFNGTGQWESIVTWRLPRVLAAAGAGVLLALAGTTIQRMTGNPMASPEVLGISSGTAIGLIVTIYFSTNVTAPLLILAGAMSAVITLAVLILLNRRTGFQSERLLLTGIAIAALFEPLRSIFLANGDPRIQQVIAWMSGSTYYVDFSTGLSALLLAALMVTLTPWLLVGWMCYRSVATLRWVWG